MNHYNFYDQYIVDGASWEEHDGKRVLVAEIVEQTLDLEIATGERIIVGDRDDVIPTDYEPRNAVGMFIKAMDDCRPLSIVTMRKEGDKLERVVFAGE